MCEKQSLPLMAQNTFFQELKRRNVFKVASIYAVTAWLIIQIVATTFPMFEFPTWSQRLIVVLILIGFPIALILAWAQESVADKKEALGEDQTAKKPVLIPWIVGLIGVAALIVSLTRPSGAKQLSVLLPEIRDERTAVIPFKNRTGNVDLDMMGSLCSDLITNGLTEVGIKTCSPRTVQQHDHLVGIPRNNIEGKTSFSEATGARYLIEGYFLQEEDTLTFKSHLTDGWNGDLVRNFPDIRGHILKKEALAKRLTRRIMGYWVSEDLIERGKFKPPLYEAYKEYQKAYMTSAWYVPGQGLKAYALDTTFYTALLDEMFFQADGHRPLYDSIFQLLAPQYGEMTDFEQSMFDANVAIYKRDYRTYKRLREKQFEQFPKDFMINATYSFHLMARENQPAKAWEVVNAIDWENISTQFESQVANRMMFICWFGLGAGYYEEVVDLADTYLRNANSRWLRGNYFQIKAPALLRNGQIEPIYRLLEEIKQSEKLRAWELPELDVVGFCYMVAKELLLMKKEQEANKFLKIALDWAYEKPDRMTTMYDSLDLATIYLLLDQPDKALQLNKNFIRADVGGTIPRSHYLSTIGITYALLKQREKAEEIIASIVEKPSENKIELYYAARTYAVMNEKEKAMELLLQWQKEWGQTYHSIIWFQNDYFMQNLFNYQPFEELVQIRDKAISD